MARVVVRGEEGWRCVRANVRKEMVSLLSHIT